MNDDSYYKTVDIVDAYDRFRDAYTYDGNLPVIGHPPCQQWSRLKHFAKPNDYEKDLAFFVLEKIQRYGGIFEHPAGSSFF